MISFLLCLAILIVGYFVYGKIVDNTFGPDDRETPAVRINDGVDYVVMPQWKLFLVQLLNMRRPWPHLWCHAGRIVGACGVPVDHLRHHLCRRRARLLLRHDERAQRRRFHRRDHRQVLRPCDAERHARVLGGAAHHGGYCVRGGSRRPDRGAVQSERGASGVLTSLLFWLIIILVYYFIATLSPLMPSLARSTPSLASA